MKPRAFVDQFGNLSPTQIGNPGVRDIPLYTRRSLSDDELAACLREANCTGAVNMTYDTGPYEVTRPTLTAVMVCRAIERALFDGPDASTQAQLPNIQPDKNTGAASKAALDASGVSPFPPGGRRLRGGGILRGPAAAVE